VAVVIIGNATVDLSYEVPRLPAQGETVLARSKVVDAGGKGLNQAIVARRAGAAVVYCAPLGQDEHAEIILDRLHRDGVLTDHLQRVPVPTDESLILVDPSGQNAIVSTAAAAHSLDEMSAAPILAQLRGGRDFLLMQGNLTRAVTASCLERARGAGVRTMLNPAPIAFDYNGLWPTVDLAIVNEVESEILTGIADPGPATQALRRAGASTVITTLGAQGARVVSAEREFAVPAPHVAAIDTTGAGDVFCGVLAAALEAQLSLEPAVRWAVTAASLSVTRRGTASAFPSADELAELRAQSLGVGALQ
jgi:ribokinase